MRNKTEFRAFLFLAQGGCCYYCGGSMSMTRKKNGGPARDFATFEHLVRRDQGGKLELGNVVLAHAKCNLKANQAWQAALKSNHHSVVNK